MGPRRGQRGGHRGLQRGVVARVGGDLPRVLQPRGDGGHQLRRLLHLRLPAAGAAPHAQPAAGTSSSRRAARPDEHGQRKRARQPVVQPAAQPDLADHLAR
eukprot:scaffold125959_cov63-Phaeocystis_antarctica.AAC.1